MNYVLVKYYVFSNEDSLRIQRLSYRPVSYYGEFASWLKLIQSYLEEGQRVEVVEIRYAEV